MNLINCRVVLDLSGFKSYYQDSNLSFNLAGNKVSSYKQNKENNNECNIHIYKIEFNDNKEEALKGILKEKISRLLDSYDSITSDIFEKTIDQINLKSPDGQQQFISLFNYTDKCQENDLKRRLASSTDYEIYCTMHQPLLKNLANILLQLNSKQSNLSVEIPQSRSQSIATSTTSTNETNPDSIFEGSLGYETSPASSTRSSYTYNLSDKDSTSDHEQTKSKENSTTRPKHGKS